MYIYIYIVNVGVHACIHIYVYMQTYLYWFQSCLFYRGSRVSLRSHKKISFWGPKGSCVYIIHTHMCICTCVHNVGSQLGP